MAARNTGKNPEDLGHGFSGTGVDLGEDITKAWNLDDPYRFAPKRPDGDPWKVLLDPLLEKERIKCDGWKDEVGNLLIFAGLFSAVVTAFLIDSYKTLQPSDNKDIIFLLSQIASNQLNSTLDPNSNGTINSTQLLLPSTTFQPPRSAVRINTLWFFSLILALFVVLIGIVALQWLRTHQSFRGQTPRASLALYRMRREGMRKWRVWEVLTALPVLLMIALVLFLLGVVDFLRTVVGVKTVWVSVCALVGVVLLFLVGTTTAPAVQMVLVPVRIWLRTVFGGTGAHGRAEKLWAPSQCPYKSPQSKLVCVLVDRVMSGCGTVLRWLMSDNIVNRDGGDGGEKGENKTKKNLKSVLTGPLLALRRTRSWIEYDLTWLNIRDAYVRGVYFARFGRLAEEEVDGGMDMGIAIPLYDTLALFRRFTKKNLGSPQSPSETDTPTLTLTTEIIVAAYHCLAEISAGLTVDRLAPGKDLKSEVEVIKEMNGYLRFSSDSQFETLEFTSTPTPPSHIGTSTSTSPGTIITLASDTVRLLHDQNLSMFLDHLSPSASASASAKSTTSATGSMNNNTGAKEVFLHRQELKVRIQLYMLARRWSLVSSSRFALGGYPNYLEFAHDRGVWRTLGDEELVFTYQYIHIINKFFAYFPRLPSIANATRTTGIEISPTDLHARSEVLVLLEECSRAIARVTANLAARPSFAYGYEHLGDRVKGMLEVVRVCLEEGVDALGAGGNGNTTRPEDVLHLFYCAGMVVCGCIGLPESVGFPTPFESAYMGLKGFLKGFKKGVMRGDGYGHGYGYVPREEQEQWDASLEEMEKRFREAYPNDGEVEKGLWDAFECGEDPGRRRDELGTSYVPFVVLGRVQMPVPRVG